MSLRSPGPSRREGQAHRGYSLAEALGTLTVTTLVAVWFVAGSEHDSASLYTRPKGDVPEVLARRLALKGPVICQSAEVAPSEPPINVRLQLTLQVSGAFKDSVTGIRLPFTGVSDVLDGTAVEVESANEYGVND